MLGVLYFECNPSHTYGTHNFSHLRITDMLSKSYGSQMTKLILVTIYRTILTKSLVVNNESEMLSVQNPIELTQSCVKVELLECIVCCCLNWVSAVYFSLEQDLSVQISKLSKYLLLAASLNVSGIV